MSRSNPLMRMLTAAVAMLAVSAFTGERLDGIAATVNGHAIMQSEVQEELAYECLMGQQACGSAGAPQRQAALDHLINQQLIAQQMQQAQFPRQAADAVKLRSLRLVAAKDGGNSWRQTLQRYGLSEEVIAERLAFEADILRFTDSRFRPFQVGEHFLEPTALSFAPDPSGNRRDRHRFGRRGGRGRSRRPD